VPAFSSPEASSRKCQTSAMADGSLGACLRLEGRAKAGAVRVKQRTSRATVFFIGLSLISGGSSATLSYDFTATYLCAAEEWRRVIVPRGDKSVTVAVVGRMDRGARPGGSSKNSTKIPTEVRLMRLLLFTAVLLAVAPMEAHGAKEPPKTLTLVSAPRTWSYASYKDPMTDDSSTVVTGVSRCEGGNGEAPSICGLTMAITRLAGQPAYVGFNLHDFPGKALNLRVDKNPAFALPSAAPFLTLKQLRTLLSGSSLLVAYVHWPDERTRYVTIPLDGFAEAWSEAGGAKP